MTAQTRTTPVFASRGWYRVRGRGWTAMVHCDQERSRKPGESGLLGPVIIDGERFECTGVESFALGTPLRKGEEIGLLVRETSS